MAVASAGPYANHLHLAHHSVFTGPMPFLATNQQRQSTEGDKPIQHNHKFLALENQLYN